MENSVIVSQSNEPPARASRDSTQKQFLTALETENYEIEYSHQTEEGLGALFLKGLDALLDKNSLDIRTAIIFAFAFLGFFIVHPVPTVCISAGTMALLGLCFLASGLFSNYPIITSPRGITWSPMHAFSLKFRFTRAWDEVKKVEFTRSGCISSNPDSVCIVYNDSGYVELRLAGFTKRNLEMLLLLIRNHCPAANWYPKDESVRLNIALAAGPTSQVSFTGLWLDEIGSRLGSTAFVPLDPGALLQDGRIKVIGQIALGGLSAIYLAQTEGKKTCILKESVVPFSAEDETRKVALDLFKREAQLLAKIDHPRISHIYDFFIEDDHHYLLMEYLEGRNLRQYIGEHGVQREAIVMVWAKQIADILSYLHSMTPPIIHRDLTPDNLMIENDGAISLIDFGAANQFLSTATGTIIGKTAYMSIEQFRGKAAPSSDVYSFGCTLQFLLLGLDPEPFSCSSTATGRNEWKTVQELIRECKNENPAARPTAQAMADRLQYLLNERGGR